MSKRKSVFFEIKGCNSCPSHKSQRYYTADSWETEFEHFCHAKPDQPKSIGIYSWNEEKELDNYIPAWCPLRKSK